MKHVMIDLETWGTGRDALIVQVGAVYFDSGTGECGRIFKASVDARTTNGGIIDPDTVYWWLSQSSEAIDSIVDEGRPEAEVLEALNNFLAEADHVWSHATFDFVLVLDALRRHKIKPLFSYRSAKDIRTLMFLAGKAKEKSVRTGVHHDALDDAIHQVEYCAAAMKKIKSMKAD